MRYYFRNWYEEREGSEPQDPPSGKREWRTQILLPFQRTGHPPGVKIATYNGHRSAPFFRALVVSATKFIRPGEPTPSSSQPQSFTQLRDNIQ